MKEQKPACFVKRTAEGYKNLFEILSYFKPDFSENFGLKCTMGSMIGSMVPWFAWAPEVTKGTFPPFFGIMFVSIFVIPMLAHPLYRAFGICYCACIP